MAAGAQISPGPLSQAHSSLAGPTKCASCHTIGGGRSLKCLDCHREIARRLDARTGYHASIGANAGECVKCHSEHKGVDTPLIRLETAKFDHSKTGYMLEGKHAAVECKKCHTAQHISEGERGSIKVKDLNRTFLGLRQNCENCHADKHQSQFADVTGGCAHCHTFAGFKSNLKFQHAEARFQLTGKHTEVACQKCHLPQGPNNVVKYVGLEFKGCASCHKDPHRATVPANCEQCHSPNAWRQVKVASSFSHPKAKFELAGKHLELRCEQCHASADFKKPIPHSLCADCHKKDIHNGQFKQRADGGECGFCHTVNGFKPTKYDVRAHAGAGYPLEGKHAEVACAKCHVPAGPATIYRLKHAHCVDCHKDSHQGQLVAARDRNCESCHTVKGFGSPKFTLARHQETRFPLTGEHRAIACIECHKAAADAPSGTPGRFRFDDRACSACHEDPHRGQFKQRMAQRRRDGSVMGCEACHATRTWREPAYFDHASTKFPLLGRHRIAPCSGCHKPPNLETTLKHVDFVSTPQRCEQCHEDNHDGQFAVRGKVPSCAECHNTFRFKPSLFDHNARAGFPLTGAHRNVRCTDCHKDSRQVQGKKIVIYKPTSSKCVDCHRATVVSAETPAN